MLFPSLHWSICSPWLSRQRRPPAHLSRSCSCTLGAGRPGQVERDIAPCQHMQGLQRNLSLPKPNESLLEPFPHSDTELEQGGRCQVLLQFPIVSSASRRDGSRCLCRHLALVWRPQRTPSALPLHPGGGQLVAPQCHRAVLCPLPLRHVLWVLFNHHNVLLADRSPLYRILTGKYFY